MVGWLSFYRACLDVSAILPGHKFSRKNIADLSYQAIAHPGLEIESDISTNTAHWMQNALNPIKRTVLVQADAVSLGHWNQDCERLSTSFQPPTKKRGLRAASGSKTTTADSSMSRMRSSG